MHEFIARLIDCGMPRKVAADEDPTTTPTPVIEMQNANLVINRVA